jgi:hypothetical protein
MMGRAERSSSRPWPGVIERMAEGSRMERSRLEAETDRPPPAWFVSLYSRSVRSPTRRAMSARSSAFEPPPSTILTMAESQMPCACSRPQRSRA